MCSNVTITELPVGITVLNDSIFYSNGHLPSVTVLGDVTSISTNVWYRCSQLSKVVLQNVTAVPTLSNTNAFGSTPIASGTGFIYVPDTLVDDFKTATNWSTYADQIKPISEMPTE